MNLIINKPKLDFDSNNNRKYSFLKKKSEISKNNMVIYILYNYIYINYYI